MQVESDGNPHAISPKGALGLMQIMPQTWVELSVHYGLGIDPFDPHDNITAGTAYLREMLDRFGSEGFLAAYNAGPKRYEDHLIAGRPLPAETQTYVAKLAALTGIEQGERDSTVVRHVVERQQAPVFVQRSDGSPANSLFAATERFVGLSKDRLNAGAAALIPRTPGLFVQQSEEIQSR